MYTLMGTTTEPSWTYNLMNMPCDVNLEVTVIAVTSCGESYPGGQVIYYACNNNFRSSLSASPNPSNGMVTLTMENKQDKIKEIKVVSKMGVVVKEIKLKEPSEKYTIDISNLAPDIYTISVFNGKTWTTSKVIKN